MSKEHILYNFCNPEASKHSFSLQMHHLYTYVSKRMLGTSSNERYHILWKLQNRRKKINAASLPFIRDWHELPKFQMAKLHVEKKIKRFCYYKITKPVRTFYRKKCAFRDRHEGLWITRWAKFV